MKKYLLFFFIPFVAMADIIPPPAATSTEVLAGTVKNKFVSPSTLAGTGLFGQANTNEIWLSPLPTSFPQYGTVGAPYCLTNAHQWAVFFGVTNWPGFPDFANTNYPMDNIPFNTTVHLMAGTFHVTNGVAMINGLKIKGAGMGKTRVVIDPSVHPGQVVFGSVSTYLSKGLTNCSVEDLTIDLNVQNALIPTAPQAVMLTGDNAAIRRVEVVNWGTTDPGNEAFLLNIEVQGGNWYGAYENGGPIHNAVIDGCVIGNPAPVLMKSGVSALNIFGYGNWGDNFALDTNSPYNVTNGWVVGAEIKNCSVAGPIYCQAGTPTAVGNPVYFHAACINNFVDGLNIHHNRFQNLFMDNADDASAVYGEVGPWRNVTVENNFFSSVNKGIFQRNANSYPKKNLVVRNNLFEISNTNNYCTGIEVDGYSANPVDGVRIEGNHIVSLVASNSTMNPAGLYFQFVTNLSVVNNYVDANGGYDSMIQTNCSVVQWWGNQNARGTNLFQRTGGTYGVVADGLGLTVPATNLTGTVADARLAGNLAGTNVFYASKRGCRLDGDPATGAGTDDSVCINSNLLWLSQHGGGSWIQDGKSFCAGTVLISNNISFVAASPGCGLVASNQMRVPLLATAGYLNQVWVSNIVLEGITFYGRAEAQTFDGGGGGMDFGHFADASVLLSAVDKISVQNCTLIHNQSFGITIGNFGNASIVGTYQYNTNCAFGTDCIHIWGPGKTILVRDTYAMTGDDAVGVCIDEVLGAGVMGGFNTNYPWATFGPVKNIRVFNTVAQPVQDWRVAGQSYDPMYFAGEGVRVLVGSNRLDSIEISGVSGGALYHAVNVATYFVPGGNFLGNIGSLTINNVSVEQAWQGGANTYQTGEEPQPAYNTILLDTRAEEVHIGNVSTNLIKDGRQPFFAGAGYQVGKLFIDGVLQYVDGNKILPVASPAFSVVANQAARLAQTNLPAGSLTLERGANLYQLVQPNTISSNGSWVSLGAFTYPSLASLQAYWSLDETNSNSGPRDRKDGSGLMRDMQGLRHLVADTNGLVGKAAFFDGTDVMTSRLPLPSHSDLTISMWIKPADFTSSQVPLSVYSKFFRTNAVAVVVPAIQIYCIGDGNFRVRTHNGVNYGDDQYFGTATVNTWNNLVVRFNAATGRERTAINGVMTNDATIRDITNSVPLSTCGDLQYWNLGAYSTTKAFFYHGAIDQVRVFAKELSDAEVTALYNGGAGN